VTIGVAKSLPTGDGCVGSPIGVDGSVPPEFDLDRPTLTPLGFDGKVGQTLTGPRRGGPSFTGVGQGRPLDPGAGERPPAGRATLRG
jgi:hypothetical protein